VLFLKTVFLFTGAKERSQCGSLDVSTNDTRGALRISRALLGGAALTIAELVLRSQPKKRIADLKSIAQAQGRIDNLRATF
jgi:hypothetical protein